MESVEKTPKPLNYPIKAGNELDRAVADAIGLELHDRGHGYARYMHAQQWYWLKGEDPPESVAVGNALANVALTFDPSDNLDLAFAAAAKVSDYFTLNKCEFTKGKWDCKLVATDLATEWYRADTPALAICAAILKAKDCLEPK